MPPNVRSPAFTRFSIFLATKQRFLWLSNSRGKTSQALVRAISISRIVRLSTVCATNRGAPASGHPPIPSSHQHDNLPCFPLYRAFGVLVPSMGPAVLAAPTDLGSPLITRHAAAHHQFILDPAIYRRYALHKFASRCERR